MKTILTLLYGSKYNADDVHRIYNATNGKYNYVCLADEKNAKHLRQEITVIPLDPELEGHWHKVGLFNINGLGDVLYLDLDIVIQGSVDKLFEFCKTPTICRTYWKNFGGEYNSSVMAWRGSDTQHIYNTFIENPDYYRVKYIDNDDWFLYNEKLITSVFPKGLIYSFLFGVDIETDISPRAFQIKPEYPIVLLNGQQETTENLRQKYYDALSMHKMG